MFDSPQLELIAILVTHSFLADPTKSALCTVSTYNGTATDVVIVSVDDYTANRGFSAFPVDSRGTIVSIFAKPCNIYPVLLR